MEERLKPRWIYKSANTRSAGTRAKDGEKEEQLFGSSMGKLTIEQRGSGWIGLEDGRRVGGTVRHPFASQAAAQRYVDAELAGEAEMMAAGDVGLSARA